MAQARTNLAIYRNALYGDEAGPTSPEDIHIESIQSRAIIHDWRISPHAHHGLYQIVLILDGGAVAKLDGDVERVEGPAAFCIPSGFVHGFTFDADTVGWVLTISETLFDSDHLRHAARLLEPMLRAPGIERFVLAADKIREVENAFALLAAEFDSDRFGRAPVLEHLACFALISIRRQSPVQPEPETISARRAAFLEFRELINRHFHENWQATDYAEQLSISSARLNRICRKFAGKSATEMIHARILLEAQRQLIYSTASSKVIAARLGFQDPAYFGRFFKRMAGVSPGDYRSRQAAG